MMPRWLPNVLSVLRIALVPAWLAFASAEDPQHTLLIAILVLIGATDVLDGILARHFHLATNAGAILDAVADKLATVVSVTFLAFAGRSAFTALPLWLWATLMGRDLLLAIGFAVVFSRHRQVHVEHRWHGRLATLILFATVVAATARSPHLLVNLGAIFVCLLVVPGTLAYLRAGWAQLRGGPPNVEPNQSVRAGNAS